VKIEIAKCQLDVAIIGARNLNNAIINPIIKVWIPKCIKDIVKEKPEIKETNAPGIK